MRLALVLVFSLVPLQVQAGDTHVREVGALDPKTLDRAESLFFQALADYRAGRYEPAATGFQETYVLTRHRDMLFNVARSREKLGDAKGAVLWYRSYLQTRPSDETAVIHRIRQLGGDPTPASPPLPGGADESEGPLVVEEGAGPWPWVSGGIGVVAAVTGLIYGKQALDSATRARAEEQRGPAQTHKDDAESKALLADVMFGTAAVGVGLSVWLWLRADATANAAGHLDISAGRDGASLGWTQSF